MDQYRLMEYRLVSVVDTQKLVLGSPVADSIGLTVSTPFV